MKNNSYFPSVFHARVFKVAFVFLILLLILKLSAQNKPAKGIGKTILSDTTKPAINHRYVLRGSDTMFIWLQSLMLSPDDVTPRQKNMVLDWFRQNIKPDSTKNK